MKFLQFYTSGDEVLLKSFWVGRVLFYHARTGGWRTILGGTGL